MRPSTSVHQLKVLPLYFWTMWEGRKTFEVRYNDRGFKSGDTLMLREWDPHTEYTGLFILADVQYVMARQDLGLFQPDVVALQLTDFRRFEPI